MSRVEVGTGESGFNCDLRKVGGDIPHANGFGDARLLHASALLRLGRGCVDFIHRK